MADDFDPLTIPAVMPARVVRTKPDGTPTEHAVKWEEGLQAWMKANTANTNTRLTLVSDEIGDVSASVATLATAQATLEGAFASYQVTVTAQFGTVNAAIVNESTARANGDSALATSITSLTATVGSNTAAISAEATARVNGDSALASSITSLSAAFGGFTASGAVYFAAMAGPPGSAAAYGIYLTAGNVFTGLQLVARSDGSSYIAMTAGQLFFYDNSSGSTINALTYSGGEWLLNGNVTLQSANGAGSFRYADGNIVLRDASNNALIELGINI